MRGAAGRRLPAALAVALALLAAMAGCIPTGEPSEALHPDLAPRPSHASYVCLRDLVRPLEATYQANELTGVHRLRRDDRQVAVVPGAAFALVGSELVELDREVVVRYGWAYVPRSLVARIERHFGRRARVEPAPDTPSQPREQVKPPKALGKVCIDAGHGGKDPGACRPWWGVKEKDIVLPTAKLLAEELRGRGFTVAMTRETDVFIDLEERPAIASRQGADAFLSVHANSMSSTSFRGIELYYWGGQRSGYGSWRTRRESRELAECLRRAFHQAGLSVRKVQGAEYRVLRFARMPAVLVEMGYLSNPTERRLLQSHEHRRRLVQAMADGLEAWWRKQ